MNIKQNDETINVFNINKIFLSLRKETNLTEDEANNIANKTEEYLEKLNLKTVESGFVRDIAYQIMLESGFNGLKIKRYAPIYIPLSELIDIDNYNSELTNDNANIGNSPESIHKRKADFVAKQQNLRMFPDYIETAHRSGDIHIHDLEYFRNRDFCADYDLRHPFFHGVSIDGGGLTSAICGPANNADVAILHAIKIIGAGQVNSAGGQGFYNFLTFMAPYFKDLSDKEIYQSLQMFIYECNTMLVARGGQAVFSSVQLTPGVPKLWKDKPCVWKGKVDNNLTYGELDSVVKRMFKTFLNIMIKGDFKGRPFSFPKPEVVVNEEFLNDNWSRQLYKKAVELSIKFGSSYYDNEYSPKRRQQKGISCYQCCAYNFTIDPKKDPDFERKMMFADGIGFSMGASQVITLNNPRLALRSKNYEDLKFKTIKLINDVIIPIFKIRDKIRPTFYRPFFNYPEGKPIFNVNDLSYVIGICGINEVCEIMEHKNITETNIGIKYVEWLNNYVNTLSYENQFEGGAKIALSRTPAETTCTRFAKLDLAKYGNEVKSYIKGDLESDAIYYTNGSMIPPEFENDIIQKFDIEGEYFKHLSGGNMLHFFLGEAHPDLDGLTEMVLKFCESDVDYFALSRDLTLCRDCKQVQYEIIDKCDKCGSQNVFSLARVTGYIQAIDGWNEGKREELKQRKRHDF